MKSTPLAFGMWTFSLPDTQRLWLHWDGPGSRLYLATNQIMRLIDHPVANGKYQTRKQAERAARAFIEAGTP